MEFDQLIDIVFKIDDTINFLWNLYLGACVVLLGWVFGSQSKWPLVKRITVSSAFILVDLINISAQLDNYRLKIITIAELRQKPEFNNSAFIQAFAKNTGVGETGVVLIHIAMGLVMLSLIWVYSGSRHLTSYRKNTTNAPAKAVNV